MYCTQITLMLLTLLSILNYWQNLKCMEYTTLCFFSWISAFLTGRLQCVVLGNKLSSYSNVLSGIAQSSVLGPLLFILFVNDLTDIFGNAADSKLFADELKLYSSYELDSANLLQIALDKLVKWSSNWQLTLNPLKSNVLYLGKSNSKSVYTINNVKIVSCDLVRDLGVGVDCGLKFSSRVQNIVTLSYQRLSVLFRGFCSRDISRNISILVMAYKVYVRPILEYCSPVWSPYLL